LLIKVKGPRGRALQRRTGDDQVKREAGRTRCDVYRELDPGPEARLAAVRSFGGVTQTSEAHHRDVRSFAWVDDLRQDL
jgi:hypothetical protein